MLGRDGQLRTEDETGLPQRIAQVQRVLARGELDFGMLMLLCCWEPGSLESGTLEETLEG